MDHVKLFLDKDGVLADFQKGAQKLFGLNAEEMHEKFGMGDHNQDLFWKTIYAADEFFYNLEPMADTFELVDAVRHLNPTILTGCPAGCATVPDQKRRWRDKHFPDLPIICEKSALKKNHKVLGMHNIIIDDWNKYKLDWEETGGTFVLHTSAKKSIAELQLMGLVLPDNHPYKA